MKRKPKQKEVNFEEAWAAGWRRKRLRELAKLPEFHGVLTLARLANILWFGFTVSVKAKGQGPDARRQQMNAFYLTGTLLVEGKKTVEGVGRYFSGQDDYIALNRAFSGEVVADFIRRFSEFRNRAAFHVNQEEMDVALERILNRDDAFFSFLTAYGTSKKEAYYDLADDAAMQHIVGDDGYGEWMKDWLEKSSEAVVELSRALEEFISGRLEQWDPEIIQREGDRPDDIEETREIMKRKEEQRTAGAE